MNNKAIKNIDLYSLVLVGRPQWNQNEYASITGPFRLKSKREGKVKPIIAGQTMLPNNYSRDFIFRVTQ